MLAIPGHDGDVMVSFSAGVTKDNLAETVAMGVNPATVCSDLLQPGGYGRLAPMLKALTAAAVDVGATDLAGLRAGALAAAEGGGHRNTAAAHLAHVTGDDLATYHLEGNSKPPRAVDHDLETWGCVACNFCVTVCPNDAFFKVPTPPELADEMSGRQQYLVLAELCNECGNCMTFCPENGDPAQIKPRLFLDRDRFDGATGQRFFVDPNDGIIVEAAAGQESELPRLVTVLRAHEGLPIAAD